MKNPKQSKAVSVLFGIVAATMLYAGGLSFVDRKLDAQQPPLPPPPIVKVVEDPAVDPVDPPAEPPKLSGVVTTRNQAPITEFETITMKVGGRIVIDTTGVDAVATEDGPKPSVAVIMYPADPDHAWTENNGRTLIVNGPITQTRYWFVQSINHPIDVNAAPLTKGWIVEVSKDGKPIDPTIDPIDPTPVDPVDPPKPIVGTNPFGETDSLRVVILYETDTINDIPKSQLYALNGKVLDDYLTATAQVGNKINWKIWDVHTDITNAAPEFQKAMQNKPVELPWIMIGNGKSGTSEKLPPDAASIITLIGRFK